LKNRFLNMIKLNMEQRASDDRLTPHGGHGRPYFYRGLRARALCLR
jgi:hypothetical protein